LPPISKEEVQVKKILTTLAILLTAGWTFSAMATPVTLDIADGSNGSSVTISNVDTGLSVLFDCDLFGIGENTAITASLETDLDDQIMTLDDYASWEVDFFTFEVTGSGIGSFDIDAVLAFDDPDISGGFSGNGYWGTLSGSFSGGILMWDSPIQSLTLADGNVLEVALEQGCTIGTSTQYTVSATITNLGGSTTPGDASPVPEPATVLLFGTGLIGLATLRRRQQRR
jgi:hypothetical protein